MPRDLEFFELNFLETTTKAKLTTFLHTDYFQKRSTVVHSYDAHFPIIKIMGYKGCRNVGKRSFKIHTQPLYSVIAILLSIEA